VVDVIACGDDHDDDPPAIGFDFVVVLRSRLIEASDNQEIGSFAPAFHSRDMLCMVFSADAGFQQVKGSVPWSWVTNAG